MLSELKTVKPKHGLYGFLQVATNGESLIYNGGRSGGGWDGRVTSVHSDGRPLTRQFGGISPERERSVSVRPSGTCVRAWGGHRERLHVE